MKKLYTLILATIFAGMTTVQAVEPVTVVDEDFAGFTQGTESEPSEEALEMGGTLGAPYFHMEGWRANGVHQAGGSAALMQWLYYDYPYNGTIQTPEMPLYGQATVTFRARRMDGEANKNASLWVSICDNDYYGPLDNKDVQLTDEWATYTFSSDKAMFNDRHIFQIQAQNGVVLIDDIKIVRIADKIPAPEPNYVENLSTSSFKASWKPVNEAEKYLFNLYCYDFASDERVEGVWTEDFSNPVGWEFGNVTPAENPNASGKGAVLSLKSSGQSAISPECEAPIDNFRFWVKPVGNENDEYGLSLLGVWVYADKWIHMANLPKSWLEPQGGIYELNAEALGLGVTKVKFEMEQADGVEFIIDDVELHYATQPVKKAVITDEPVDGTEKIVNDINPTLDYYFYVKASGNALVSEESSHILVDGLTGLKVNALDATEVTPDSFRANWEALPHADTYTVDIKQATTATEDLPGTIVLHEDFNKINEGTIENPQIEWINVNLLDKGYADTEWSVTQPQYAAGMAGTRGTNWLNQAGLVASPVLDLSNNNGAFDVEATVYALSDKGFTEDEGESIFVMLIESLESTQALAAQEIKFELGEKGSKTARLHFDNGGKKDVMVAFMSKSGLGFFVDEVTITQDLKAGETLNRPYKTLTASDNVLKLEGLVAGDTYTYTVKGSRKKDYITYSSLVSDPVTVTLAGSGSVDNAMSEATDVVKVMANGIEVASQTGTNYAIYTVNGICTKTGWLPAGQNVIALPSGAYIVKIGNTKPIKAMIRN